MDSHYIAFWNLENLFDKSTSQDRPEYLKNRLKKELTGWTANILKKKVKQLVKIISQMNDGKGPDILGVCEIENENVIKLLLAEMPAGSRQYKIAHADT